MEQIRSARAIKIGNEVIVEGQRTDDHGAVDVISYQFAAENDGQELTPKEPVADEHVSIVSDPLSKVEFGWVHGRTSIRSSEADYACFSIQQLISATLRADLPLCAEYRARALFRR